MRIALIFSLSFGLLAGATAGSAHETGVPPVLGTVNFANSCEPQAQESLERGIAYLHSFTYALGEKAFNEALERDPTCAIAAWGIASLLINNPFSIGPTPEAARRAKDIIDRGLTMGAKTERERDFIKAIAAYYDHFD
jgi:hypothetical protein